MKKIIITTSILFSSFSWANRESGGRVEASAVYVEFASYGTGVNTQAQFIYKELVATAHSQGLVLDEKLLARGREGEALHCVLLTSANARFNLIKKLAPNILSDNNSNRLERTVVYVGVDCLNLKKATKQDLRGYVSR